MKPTPSRATVKLKSYMGTITEKPLFDLMICQSIYPCCTEFFVNGTYYIDGVIGPIKQQHTLAVCQSLDEAKSALAEGGDRD